MGRAEVGTPKYVANQMKAKGLQRLRWYCQVCEKQCRDENGFKCHTQSESHLRQMLLVGENPRKSIEEFSRQFKHDFLFLLRTGHGEKSINANRFYQEYIGNKQHIHMNGTKWVTLTEFVKYLGREGICRVEDSEEDGLCLAWIDNSPETLKRREALRKKERGERGDEHIAAKILERQIEQAKNMVDKSRQALEADHELKRTAPVALSINVNKAVKPEVVKPIRVKNVFSSKSTGVGGVKKTHKPPTSPAGKPLNAFERIMLKEQARRQGR
jgi:DNA/RNA-binding protein KIN17